MDENLKALLAKCWKNELLDLEVGTSFVDEVITIHVCGTVVKQSDQMVAPTTSLLSAAAGRRATWSAPVGVDRRGLMAVGVS